MILKKALQNITNAKKKETKNIKTANMIVVSRFTLSETTILYFKMNN